MNKKVQILNSLYFAVVAALFSYFLIIVSTAPFIIKSDVKEFEITTQQIENYKQKIVLMGLLAESELKSLSHFSAEEINNTIVDSFSDGIYSVDNTPLNFSEAVARKVMHDTVNHFSDFINNDMLTLIYRSYKGKKLISSNPVANFTATDELFSKERCDYNQTCTLYAWPDQLTDRLIISGIFIDALVGHQVIAISSPVYMNSKIVGDYLMLIYIDNGLMANKDFSTRYEGRQKQAILSHEGYPLQDIAFTNTYVADNNTVFIYSYPLSKLLITNIGIFFILVAVIFILHFKNNESKQQKDLLNKALTLATIDELTGLFNRKVFKEEAFIKQTEVHPCAIVAIDGDKIKYVNDKHGHHIGDEAIKHIADSMRRVFRKTDYLIRSGGDEFLAILPDCDLINAEQLALKLRETVVSSPISYLNINISVSTGVSFKKSLDLLQEKIVDADQKLYEQKRKKQNSIPIDSAKSISHKSPA